MPHFASKTRLAEAWFFGRKTESTTPSFLGGNRILDWRDLPIYVSSLLRHELLRLVFTAFGG